MEEIKSIILDKVQNLVDDRTYTSDPVAYTAKWDFLQTSVVFVIHNLKDATSKSVFSSSRRQDLLEAKLASITTVQQAMVIKQAEMDERMKAMNARQDIIVADLKVIMDLLKKP